MTTNPSHPRDRDPDTMDIDLPTTTTKPKKQSKTHTLTTTTLRSPPFSYAHLTLARGPDSSSATNQDSTLLDTLQVRSYLTTALRQFLGDTGAAIPIDILLIRGASVWVRVPREDLPAFAAGVTAFAGLPSSSFGGGNGNGMVGEGRVVLRVKACGDWLGSLIGREEEGGLWTD